MLRASQRELAAHGLGDPEVVLADAGYWHQRQMQQLAGEGIPVLVPPDAGLPRTAAGLDRRHVLIHAPRARYAARS